MIKFSIQSVKQHTLYDYMRRNVGLYCQYDEENYEFCVVGLDCGFNDEGYPKIIRTLMDKNIKFFFYLEPYHLVSPEPCKSCKVSHMDPIIKHDSFCGFITHSSETKRTLEGWYDKPAHLLDVGTDEIPSDVLRKKLDRLDEKKFVDLMFWGCWNDLMHNNFVGRGGDKVDRICELLMNKYEHVRLIIRAPRPLRAEKEFASRIKRVVDYVPYETLYNLHLHSDLMLLPSNTVRAVTIPFALSFGIPIVANNNFGMEDFLTHNYNALMYDDDDAYIDNAIEGISELIEHKQHLKQLSIQALQSHAKHSSKNYDLNLYSIFNQYRYVKQESGHMQKDKVKQHLLDPGRSILSNQLPSIDLVEFQYL